MKKIDFNTVVHVVSLSLFIAIILFITAINCKAQGGELTRSQERMYQKVLKTVPREDKFKAHYSREHFLEIRSRTDSLNSVSGIVLTSSQERRYQKAIMHVVQGFNVYTRQIFSAGEIDRGIKVRTGYGQSQSERKKKVISGGTIGPSINVRRQNSE